MGYQIKRAAVGADLSDSPVYVVSIPAVVEIRIAGHAAEDEVEARYHAEELFAQMGSASLSLEAELSQGVATVFPMPITVQVPEA